MEIEFPTEVVEDYGVLFYNQLEKVRHEAARDKEDHTEEYLAGAACVYVAQAVLESAFKEFFPEDEEDIDDENLRTWKEGHDETE